jgi:hypothetical protein
MSQEHREEITEINQDTNIFTLKLGDIIEIYAPKNDVLNEHTFFIEYINDIRMVLLNVATMEQIQLNREKETGIFTDKSIVEIRLMSRSEQSGYARQNNLLVGTWIEIHIGGDVSTIITGEITNLDEDQIEVTTVPEMDIIYIDFEYKGIPEDIPIKSIVIRDKPSAYKKVSFAVSDEMESPISDSQDPTMEYLETGEVKIHADEEAEEEESVMDLLRVQIAKSKEVVFGEDLETVEHISEIPESQKRYNIDLQTTSLLDELLSTIPSVQRNSSTMQKIHALIARYRELRRKFSVFDDNGEVITLKRNNPHMHKPLVDTIAQLDSKLDWILPVVSIQKKVYVNNDEEKDALASSDEIIPEIFDHVLDAEEKIKKSTYYNEQTVSDESKYYKLYQQLDDFMRPFENPSMSPQYLASKEVRASMETIVNNLDDFYSSVMKISGNSENIIRRRYVIQKYDLGLNKRSIQTRGDREVVHTEVLTRPDKMTIQSLVVLPAPVMNYSRVHLPSTSILEKANLHLFPLMLFRILKKNKDIAPFIIEDLEKELYEYDGEETDTFLKEIRHYVLSENLKINDPDFEKFLQTIIPKTKTIIKIIRKYVTQKLSLVSVVQALEPFKIYSEDLSYTQYLEIRRFILEQIEKKKEHLDKKRKEFGFLSNHKFDIQPHVLTILKFLLEKPDLLEKLLLGYKLPERDFIQSKFTTAEILNKILQADNGVLLSSLIGTMMSSLLTPTSLSSLFDPPNVAESEYEKVKTEDCNRRVLTKRYSSVAELQKDNGSDSIYYDADFDETPYHIMNQYKEEKKKMLPDKYERFIIENLIERHDCPKEKAPELAKTLIAGKKLVKDGEYAMLVIKPHIEKGDLSSLSLEDRRKAEDEANIRAKTTYYYRKNGTWIHYNDIDEDAFVDTNDLFCNLKETCNMKYSSTDPLCESHDQAAKRMREIARKKIQGEFDKRFELSYEDMKSTMQETIGAHLRYLQKLLRIQSIQHEKYNNIAYQIGLEATGYSDAVTSPYVGLRDRILGQTDFVKKQHDIVRLYDRFCREPMDLLNEDHGWKYCKETNAKLLPAFLYELAVAFVRGGDYKLKLEEICHTQGFMSDAGNAIVDRHSGFIIRYIDYAEEDGYDAGGFKLTTHAFMEKGETEKAVENLLQSYSTVGSNATGVKLTICESERNQMICNLLDAIAKQIGHPLKDVRDYSLRIAASLCDSLIDTEEKYAKEAKKIEEKKGIKLPPYKKRMNQLTIIITAAAFFTAIQTETPSFTTKKTMPGCVKSFNGYPLSGEEDVSGIRYLACVLSKMEKKIEPYNSIERMTVSMIEDQIKKIIQSAIKIAEVDDRYVKKREYLLTHFEESIPTEHAIDKWRHFLPPLIDTNITSSLRSVSSDFKDEFISLMRKGHASQHKNFMVLKSKISAFSYGIIELIQKVVQGKELLLTAASSGQPFLQNVCCNEKDRDHIPLVYFEKEKEEIKQYAKIVATLTTLVYHAASIAKPAILYDPRDTHLKYPPMPTDISEQNVYAAIIHYCELDKGHGVPIRFHGFFTDIPGGYPERGTIDEKIDFLKRQDKRFQSEQLYELMRIVNKENRIVLKTSNKYNVTEVLKDLIKLFDEHQSPVIDKKLRENLLNVLIKYDKTKLMTIAEEMDNKTPESDKERMTAIKNLKNGLADMLENRFKPSVLSFLKKYGKMGSRDYTVMSSFFDTFVKVWATPDLYKVSRYIKNAVDEMTCVFPNILITNATNLSRVHSHWDLAPVDSAKIFRSIQGYYEPLGEFRQDPVLVRLLTSIQSKFVDLRLFFENIPIQESVQIGSRNYFSLFDKDVIQLLLEYIFLSVLHEYIIATDDINLIRLDQSERRIESRNQNAENAENNNIESEYIDVAEEYQEMYGNMAEIQIQSGNKEELKTRVAKMLIAFMNIARKNKAEIDISYMNISAAIRKRKENEKNRIVERMTIMSPDERAVEDMKKKYKMDEWNVGTQRGIFQYDKKTSEREVREQSIEDALDIQKHGLRQTDFISIHADTEDMEDTLREFIDMNTMRSDIDEAVDEETIATGLASLKRNFMDGQFYSDDESDDGFGDDA